MFNCHRLGFQPQSGIANSKNVIYNAIDAGRPNVDN